MLATTRSPPIAALGAAASGASWRRTRIGSRKIIVASIVAPGSAPTVRAV
ncbi:hypothetical protein [Methylobacterium sp. SI9]